jgi:hypothetical protein
MTMSGRYRAGALSPGVAFTVAAPGAGPSLVCKRMNRSMAAMDKASGEFAKMSAATSKNECNDFKKWVQSF